MPVLNWIGKESVSKYHKQVPFHILNNIRNVSETEDLKENLIIEGDNLKVLKSLLPRYSGRVKCIYIDPPYNTGKESWIYNDNVNDPRLKAWISEVVGKESEDLSRHDKWLCMMYPRLLLAKEFLTEDGVIFVSIDDNELHNLRIIMDEIFKPKNLLACFPWQSDGNFDNQAKVKITHEYILAYTNDYSKFPHPPTIDPNTSEGSKLFKEAIRNTIVKNGPKNPVSTITLPEGFPCDFEKGTITARDNAWPKLDRDLVVENFKTLNPVEASSGWSSKKIFENFINNGFSPVMDTKKQETYFTLTKNGSIEYIKRREESNQSHVTSILRELGSTQSMSNTLSSMGLKFDYPKPTQLLEYLISMISGENFIVMDFFAGSGSTGEAVLNLNKRDQNMDKRNFILVEWKEEIANDICAKRLEMVIEGYEVTNNKGQKTSYVGTGGSFQYLKLGDPYIDEYGNLNSSLTVENLKNHIYFTEFDLPLNEPIQQEYLLGNSNDSALYFLYVEDGKTEFNIENVLNLDLSTLQKINYDGHKVVFGLSCSLSQERLKRENISFKQIPYELRVK